ncbi:LuxR C-terminal-related transcriptional regulator [Streptomyces sioyaensis]|uniref:response regulator transcription factor n=1 Tax=Streptomyces sioyaensis TaxID=67364 RepID=UPI00367687BF
MVAQFNLVIADSRELFREGLSALCTAEPGIQVVGQADDGLETLSLIRKERPEVVLIDAELPEVGAVRTAHQEPMAPRLVMLTPHEDAHLMERAMSVRPHACVSKDSTRAELFETVRAIVSNGDRMFMSFSRGVAEQLRFPSKSPLTTREKEILQLVSFGCRNAQVASSLCVTEGTVKRHLSNIYVKLDVGSRMEAVHTGVKLRLITGIH